MSSVQLQRRHGFQHVLVIAHPRIRRRIDALLSAVKLTACYVDPESKVD
jgi:hypothetical protein